MRHEVVEHDLAGYRSHAEQSSRLRNQE